MTSTSADPAVTEFAGQLLFALWRTTHARTEEALESVGLSSATFSLLNVLGSRDGAIQQQLSAEMAIDPSAMVKLIDELERAELAQRRRRAGDRRAWEVTITPAGRRTLRGARESVAHVQDEVLGGLSAGERRRLLGLLRRALEAAPPRPTWGSGESG